MTTRDRLVSAMAASMRERGLGSSAINDVLERANVTAGSMYHFFPDGKVQLATETIERAGAVGHQTLVEALANTDSVADGVATFFELLSEDLASSDFVLGCPIGVPTSEASGTNQEVREAGRAVFALWAETIAAALEREGWEEPAASSMARVCVALYEGASLVARADRDAAVVCDAAGAARSLLGGPAQ